MWFEIGGGGPNKKKEVWDKNERIKTEHGNLILRFLRCATTSEEFIIGGLRPVFPHFLDNTISCETPGHSSYKKLPKEEEKNLRGPPAQPSWIRNPPGSNTLGNPVFPIPI